MLDDMEFISKIDKSNMLDFLAQFPKQIKDTVTIVDSIDLPSLFKVDTIIICGMGGSAISGDFVKDFLRDKLDIPIFVNREYDLPKWANKNTLLLSQSYSGDTEETLRSLKHAIMKKCKIIGISSGGKLEQYCKKRSIPHIKIPSGLVPRAATAYFVFSGLLILRKTGLFKHTITSEIRETIRVVEEFRDVNNKKICTKENLSKQTASKIFNTIPQVYGWDIYVSIARRWCTQFNENSKMIARYDVVPECNHNDIVGWSMDPKTSQNFSCILFRDSNLESVNMARRLNFMRDLFKDVAGNVVEIKVKGKKKLAKMMYSMYLGDFTSCYLALLRNIDPTPIHIVDNLKQILVEA